MPNTGWKPDILLCAFISAFAASGCGPEPDESIPVDHRMGFLPDSMRQPASTSPAGYVLHPPSWARIHRDSLCLAVDAPDSVSKFFSLHILLRNPRNGDTLGTGWTTFFPLFRNRDVSCRPALDLGGREAWQAPVALELTLKEFPESPLLASRKLVVDPDFAQLDLQPFPVRFFPDRPGMEWLLEESIDPGSSWRQIRRLVSWTVLPEDPEGICRDSVVRLQYHARDCAQGDPDAPDADLLRCSAALDSASAAGPLVLKETRVCAGGRHALLDSAVLSNEEDGYGAAFLFGKSRATLRIQGGFDGLSWDIRSAESIGDYSLISVDSTTGVRVESRILAVK